MTTPATTSAAPEGVTMYVKVEAFNPLGSVKDRMDRPSWQDIETYIANSPIFHIDQMDTPLLVAFGDEGGGRRR